MPADALPAATVVLARAVEQGAFEVFLVKRHGKSGFMAGAHVFPGGRVDDADRAFAAACDDADRARVAALVPGVPHDVATGFAIAAIRETAEECGVLLARARDGASPSREVAARVFARLMDGAPFGAVLDDLALRPDLSALAPLAWWITPDAEPKRFDTRFFLAAAPVDHEAAADRRETTEGAWFTPGAALAAYEGGTIHLAPPTLATLEDLALSSTLEAARAAAAAGAFAPIQPVITEEDGGLVLALPGDALHPVAARTSSRRTRIVMTPAGRFASR